MSPKDVRPNQLVKDGHGNILRVVSKSEEKPGLVKVSSFVKNVNPKPLELVRAEWYEYALDLTLISEYC